MREFAWVFLVGAAGCGGGSAGTVDANATPAQCEADFRVDRACTAPTDCVLLAHPDCCGNVLIGVASAGEAAATSAEAVYGPCEDAACGARGCDHQDQAEDGMVPTQGQAIVTTCIDHLCSSTVQ